MPEVYLSSKRAKYKVAFGTNLTSASFGALNETATEPTGDGVINVDPMCSGHVSSQVRVLPFGDDAANETFNGRIVHWAKDQAKGVWIPSELLTFACTLGAATLVNTEFFADTITLTSGLTTDTTLVSPADDTRAWLLTDIMGAEKIQFQVDMVTALNANFYYHLL
jgi:hypothetical protein